MSLDEVFNPEDWELDEERTNYLTNRGFEIIEGTPSEDENYPFLTLRDLDHDTFDNPGITYHQEQGSRVEAGSFFHPSLEAESNLVLVLAAAVASGMTYDKDYSISVPGQRIKVFV